MWWRGREEIQNQHAAVYDKIFRGRNLAIGEIAAKYPAPDIATLHAPWVMTHVADKSIGERKGILFFLLMREAGTWKIAVVRNTEAGSPAPS